MLGIGWLFRQYIELLLLICENMLLVRLGRIAERDQGEGNPQLCPFQHGLWTMGHAGRIMCRRGNVVALFNSALTLAHQVFSRL